MKIFSLKKVIISSLLLTISFFIEFVFTKFFFQDCHGSLIKLELLPIVLIGFLFGLKFSLCANLVYVMIHTALEWPIINMFILNQTRYLQLSFLMFFFIFPYMAYSLSGLFQIKNSPYLMKKNIIKSLLLISFMQIISYILCIYSFYYYSYDSLFLIFESDSWIITHLNPFLSIYWILVIYINIMILLTNTLIGCILLFLKPIINENTEFNL
ncbi:hypothetical protein OC707_00870 ['Opuntia sp.' phytoplasma]|uniref:Uncharacterized protein n=1 Tax=Candidatus Phytoplasma asiaticum TaxID=2763338 RepID=A0AAX3B952_9MOLU|nr:MULTISPECIES: hypothetical protein [Phytoplasma]MDO8054009.1 hypothetical protein ['Opuntia sp.' phytoplasma]MDO8057872.1 hypothetical protein ['Opuntia sp.' phytoplasma]UQV27090.1 hypothetical protein H7686_0001860 ['Parthenium hysterophorus' phyllody phytoplasma]